MSMPPAVRKKSRKRDITKHHTVSDKKRSDVVGIMRNIALVANVIVYFTFPVLAIYVNIFMPEIVNDAQDPVSHWAKYLAILGAAPAAVVLSLAVFIEAFVKVKNDRVLILTLIGVFGTLFSLAALFIGLAAVFVFELSIRGIS